MRIICFFLRVAVIFLTWNVLPAQNYEPQSPRALLSLLNRNLEQEDLDENVRLGARFITDSLVHSDCTTWGHIFHKIGVSHYLLNQESQAIQSFKKAIDTWDQDCADVSPVDYANTLYNIAVSYQYTSEIHHGSSFMNRALQIIESDTTLSLLEKAYKFQGAGDFFSEIRDVSRAEIYYDRALTILTEYPSEQIEVFYLYNSLVILNMDTKKYDRAKYFLKKAIELENQGTQIDEEDLAYIYLNGSIIFLEENILDSAQLFAQTGKEYLEDIDNPDLLANALEILGTIALLEDNLNEAENLFNQTLEIRTGQILIQGYQKQALAYQNLADLALKKNQIESAVNYVNIALRTVSPYLNYDDFQNPILLNRILSSKLLMMNFLSLKSEILQHAEHPDIAQIYSLYEKIDTLITQGIQDYFFDDSRIEFFEISQVHYQNAVRYLMDRYTQYGEEMLLEKAITLSSKSKALVLQLQLLESNNLNASEDPDYLNEKKNLEIALSTVTDYLNQGGANPDSLLSVYAKIQLELSQLYDNWKAVNLNQTTQQLLGADQMALEEIQQGLKNNQVCLDYMILPDRLIIISISQQELQGISKPLMNSMMDSINTLIMSCQQNEITFPVKLSESIANFLIPEFMIPPACNELIFIPDGQLLKLPFEVLIKEQHYLIEEFAVHYLYSLSMLESPQKVNRTSTYVGFGTSYAQGLNQSLADLRLIDQATTLSSLYLSEEEIRNSANIWDGQVYLGPQASLENFLDQGIHQDIVHLSLHGLVDEINPAKSCIVFDNTTNPFVLTPSLLQATPLHARLVILSACHSANGKIFQGEGISGMTRAFLYTGAKSVVSSLWSASEQSSMSILLPFLQKIRKGNDLNQSLKLAKLDYLKNASPSQKHPYYWANLVLIGEPQPVLVSPRNYWLLVIGLLTFFFSLGLYKRWSKK